MITMTVNDLLNVIPILRELLNKPFKGSTAFKLARLMRELDKETKLFEVGLKVNLTLEVNSEDMQ